LSLVAKIIIKVIISALLVAGISEISRRNTSIAALLAALPFISLLAMLWMYHDTRDVNQIAEFSWSVFWYVLPSLILFVMLPILLTRTHWPFYPALLASSAATVVGFFILKAVLKRFGVEL
jgi:hypothetical protein